MTNSLTIYDPINDKQWNQIVEKILADIDAEDANIPEKVIKAIEYLLAGFSLKETALNLGVHPRTVKRWLTRYPIIAKVLADHQASIAKWRMAKLERQLLKALECSESILDLNPKETECIDTKILSAQAMHARFIINLFTGQKLDVHVTHDVEGQLTLKASKDAMEYIAERTAEMLNESDIEPVEATYRIESQSQNNPPLQTSTGDSNFGEMGVLDINPDGTLCHVCGKRYKGIKAHIQNSHGLSAVDYEIIYMLDPGSLRDTKSSGDVNDG
jgi:hypothetical protein